MVEMRGVMGRRAEMRGVMAAARVNVASKASWRNTRTNGALIQFSISSRPWARLGVDLIS
jgi:hypothetical protein